MQVVDRMGIAHLVIVKEVMKTSSAKAKGRNLQKYVVERLLYWFPSFGPKDVTSRSMGAQGTDILLSEYAQGKFRYSVECKSHARYAIYSDYEQAKTNAGGYEPLLIIKQNNSKPLAVLDLDYFIELSRNLS